MKIYLLNPPFVKGFVRCGRWQGAAARSGGMDYPKWLAYATALLEETSKTKLVDAPARKMDIENVIRDAKDFRPNLLVIESNFSSLHNDINAAALLKQSTGAQTIFVGPPASQYSDLILQNDGVDIVAQFEYDFTIREIAESLENNCDLKGIKGISYKEKGKIIHNGNRDLSTSEDLEKIPFVSEIYKKHLNIYDYFLSQSLYPEVQIFAGRGCPQRCTFCSWPVTLMGRKYRARSALNIANEFEYIQDELPNVQEIFIEDDTFTISSKLVRAFCEEIKKRKIDISWSCNARADLDYETMREMKRAGCRLVIVGYESGSDEILKTIKKEVTTQQMKDFTRDVKRARILIHGDFIFGLPGETKETADKTKRFIKELKPNILQVAVATPIPGTEFYNWARQNNYLIYKDLEESIDSSGYQKCIISYPEFSKNDIECYVDRALKEYYLSPSYIPVALENILRKGGYQELKLMLRSVKSFYRYLDRRSDSD